MQRDWLTAREAAELSGYHLESIRRLIRDGKIKAQKFTFVWMVDRSSLLAYVEDSKRSEDSRKGPKDGRRKTLNA